MKSIGVAVIGLGYWGPNLVRNFSAAEGADLLWGCDLNEQLCEKIASQYPSTKTTTDYQKILDDQKTELVVIATPVATHYMLVKQALEAGKHVMVEKPMTQTVAEAEELVTLAKEKNRIFAVDHPFVFSGIVKKMKALVAEGTIGDPLYFDSVRINLGLFRSDVNVIWDLLPHDLSILEEIIPDQPISVQAIGLDHFNRNNEDVAYVALRYPNNFTAHIHMSWTSPVKIRHMILGGTKKMIVVNDVAPDEKLKIYDRGVDQEQQEKKRTPFQPLYRSGDVLIPKIQETEPLADEVAEILAAIRDEGELSASGKIGLNIVRILEATDKSMKNNGSKIKL